MKSIYQKILAGLIIVFLLACWCGECKKQKSTEIQMNLYKAEYQRIHKNIYNASQKK